MFNETLLPYVKSMNNELRKTLFNVLQDFEYKNITLELTILHGTLQTDGLFCLVDRLEHKTVYFFKIINFGVTEKKVNIVSLFKISFDQWVNFGGNAIITKPGFMRNNTPHFINEIKRYLNIPKKIIIKKDNTKIQSIQKQIRLLQRLLEIEIN